GLEIKAVIGLDMLGDADLGIAMPENSDAALMDKVEAAAKRCQVEVKRMDGKVKDDHAQFAALGYPAVDLIDFEYPYWHTPEDTIDHISKDSLKKSGMLVAELVGDLIQ
ncbi:MAG: M28 family peptidase, partial [Kiritimatiellae bacterium]|nr:M28 family peptidase [Kiritimatiellia bacterium]